MFLGTMDDGVLRKLAVLALQRQVHEAQLSIARRRQHFQRRGISSIHGGILYVETDERRRAHVAGSLSERNGRRVQTVEGPHTE